MDVAIRERKAHLSGYLERVRQGEVIIVTNRGRRLARILPEPGLDAIERGIAEGWTRPGNGASPRTVRLVRPIDGTPGSAAPIRRDRDA